MTTDDETLPSSWHTLPAGLRKPFLTVTETVQVTGLSRSKLYRLWSDGRSGFPRRHPSTGRVPTVRVLEYMEAS